MARTTSIWIIALTLTLAAWAAADSTVAQSGKASAVAAIEPKTNRDQPARQRFRDARSFYAYYGGGKVSELSRYDIAVLHTPMMTSADVRRLSEMGVVTVGYISIGESSKLFDGDGSGPGGKASWYFDQDGNGEPDQNAIWKSWYANTNDPAWRANRVAEAKRLVEEYGFDGIFLDVLNVSEIYPESRLGMLQMIRDLREALPEAVIVMNQGFDLVAESAPLVDGFMMESFTATYDFETKQYRLHDSASLDFALRRATTILNPAIEKAPLRVLVLDYATPADRESLQFAANRAASLGYLFSATNIMLDDVYADLPVGEADAKWLQRQMTPEKLAYKMTDAANGFPAGTVVTPSSCFIGYGVKPVVDPSTDRSGYSWGDAAWASAEDGEEPWLQIDMPEPRQGGSLLINWHDAAGPSRNFEVQVRANNDAPWQSANSSVDSVAQISKHTLPNTNFRQIRITQPADGGSVDRPGLMWIARVELLKP
jgi:hypothetical protein